MSRYIDADKLIKSIPPYRGEYPVMMKAVWAAIDATPTADVVEVRHGKWVKTNSRLAEMTCSLCGFTYYGEHDEECMSNFCPECGAKMDGERREENER